MTARGQSRLKLGTGSFWLESVALPFGMLALQALPLGALLPLGAAWQANDASQALLPTWALLLLLAEAFYLARWLTRQPALRGWIVALMTLAGLATLLLVLFLRWYVESGPIWQTTWLSALFQDLQFNSGRTAEPIAVVVLLALLWWRGLRLGSATIEQEQVARNFKVGFGVLVAALLFVGTVSAGARDALVVQLGLTLPIFLFVGLVSLSLARLAEIRRARSAQGKAQGDPTRFWLIAMLALSAVLVLLLLGIEQAFSYHTILGVFAAIGVVWDAITAVIAWIVVGIAFILYWIYYPLSLLYQLIFGTSHQKAQPTAPSPPQKPPPLAGKHGAALPTEWLVIGQWVLIALGVLLLLFLLIRAFRGFAAWRRDESADEEREDLGAANVLGAQLRALLANLAARFQRKPPAEDEADRLASHSVRALYRRVLRQAAAQGLGRRAAETPQEFAERIGPAVALLPASPSLSGSAPASGAASGFPDASMEAVTKAYEQARYGDYEPPAEQLASLTTDVERLLQRMGKPGSERR